MSRWADSTDDEDDYSQDEDHEDYIDHAIDADQVSKILSFNDVGDIHCGA